jgi:cobalt/nickel transport system permease protein
MSGVHLRRSYGDVDSPIHRAPASLKLGATMTLVAGLALVPLHYAATCALVSLVLVAGASRLGRVPASAFVARIALAEPFVLGVAVLSLFQGGGLAVFASVALKSTASVAAVQLLAHTTRFEDVLGVLRKAGFPAILVQTLALLHRYLHVMVEESRRMQRARAARTWHARPLAAWRAHASTIGLSFVRSVSRAERIFAAMLARGWS